MGLRERLNSRTDLSFHLGGSDWTPRNSAQAARHVQLLLANAGQTPPHPFVLKELHLELSTVWERTGSLSSVSPRTLRRSPFFVFLPLPDGGPPLAADENFRPEYLHWLERDARASAVAVTIKEFLKLYPREQGWFEIWRRNLSSILRDRAEPPVLRWRQRDDAVGLLTKNGPGRLADAFIESNVDERTFLSTAGLDGELEKSRLLRAVHSSAVDTLGVAVQRDDGVRVRRILEFVAGSARKLRFEELRVQFASALLKPFRMTNPSRKEEKDAYQAALLGALGDPRIAPAAWVGVPDAERATMLRWLTSISFDTFIKILDLTAAENWQDRRDFWEGYLPSERSPGSLVEAWPVLGPTAKDLARDKLKLDRQLYGEFPGRTGSNQSILIMRLRGPIGSVVVCEWSHGGAIRFWTETGESPPPLYRDKYQTKHFMVAPDFWVSHDPHGKWKQKVKDWLLGETGARPRR